MWQFIVLYDSFQIVGRSKCVLTVVKYVKLFNISWCIFAKMQCNEIKCNAMQRKYPNDARLNFFFKSILILLGINCVTCNFERITRCNVLDVKVFMTLSHHSLLTPRKACAK